MQTVSENWKNAHQQTLLNESFVEVSLDVTDPDAIADASPQDNGAVYISDSSVLTNGVDKSPSPYCTLEQNIWLLDGGRKALPEVDHGESGYVGDALSDAQCVFSDKMPVITINFSKEFIEPIPGITITWSDTYGEFADTFSVIAYRGSIIVAEKEVIGNRSVNSLVMMDIDNYDRIVIQVKKWCLPYHRARIEDIFIGIHKIYSKSDLFNYSHKQSVDPLSLSLPKTEITFSIDNSNGEYNPLNAEGLTKYLMERQEIKTRYGLKLNDGTIEWIKGGTFYLSEWNSKQNGMTADFTARDLLEFMSTIYEEEHDLSDRTLYDLAELVLNAANLPLNSDGTVKWNIDEHLKWERTCAPLPKDTCANCLQLIANAGKAVIYQDREGVLRIEYRPSTPEHIDTDYAINSFNSYAKPEMTLRKITARANMKWYKYTMNDGKIQSQSAERTSSVYPSGETIVIDNPLIDTEAHAGQVGWWVLTHLYHHRKRLNFSWRTDVRIDALDQPVYGTLYDTRAAVMTDIEFKFNGAFRGTGEGRVLEYE